MKKKYGVEFKTRVAVEALKENKTIAELSSNFSVHPTQIKDWKRKVVEGIPSILSSSKSRKKKKEITSESDLYEAIGRLKIENSFLKKKLNQYLEKNVCL